MLRKRDWSLPAEVAASIGIIILVGLCIGAFFKIAYDWNWGTMFPYWRLFVKGLGLTVIISLGALVVAVLIGLLLALAQSCGSKVLRVSSRVYIELIRGTPLLVQLLIGNFIFAQAAGFRSPLIVGILLLAIFSGAYLAEIFRGGVASVSASQIEAARAVGFDRQQTFRFVILPQALRRVLPAVTGQLVNLVKDSSLLSVISIQEFTFQAQAVNAETYNSLEGFIPLAIGYLLITIPIGAYAAWQERRLRYAD